MDLGALWASYGIESNFCLLGQNGDSDLAAYEIVSPTGNYYRPAAAGALKVSSGDAADAAAGTGARTVQIVGLTAAGAIVAETVTLNGTTQVTTSLATMVAVLSARVLTVGTGGTNAGIIYVHTGTVTAGVPDDLTLVYAHIPIGASETLSASWEVPAGRTLRITDIDITLSTTTATAQVQLHTWSAAGVKKVYNLPSYAGTRKYEAHRISQKLLTMTAGMRFALAVKTSADNQVVSAAIVGSLA